MIKFDYDDSMSLANYLLKICIDDYSASGKKSDLINNFMLQKCLYHLQLLYCVATHGNLLFHDEFEAWPYGPVLVDVYYEFSLNGGGRIQKCRKPEEVPPLKISKFLSDGIRKIRDWTPWEFDQYHRAPDTPWYIAHELGDYTPISNESIIEVYA